MKIMRYNEANVRAVLNMKFRAVESAMHELWVVGYNLNDKCYTSLVAERALIEKQMTRGKREKT